MYVICEKISVHFSTLQFKHRKLKKLKKLTDFYKIFRLFIETFKRTNMSKTIAVMMPANFAKNLAKLIAKAEEDDDIEELITNFVSELKPAKAATRKAKKDPNAPKRGSSGYIFYGKKRRPEIKDEDPGLSFGDITKQIAAEWKELSDKEKKPYLAKAAADKKRYEKEKAAYDSGDEKPQKKSSKKSDVESDDEPSDSEDKPKSKAKGKTTPKSKAKKPTKEESDNEESDDEDKPKSKAKKSAKKEESDNEESDEEPKSKAKKSSKEESDDEEDEKTEEEKVAHQKMTVAQLRELCKKRKIDAAKLKTKQQLIDALDEE